MPLSYRKNVAIIIFNQKGEILLMKRKRGMREGRKPYWQFPQGGIEKGETVKSAAFKEAKEEIGAKKNNLFFLGQSQKTYKYDFKNQRDFGKYKARGQEQKFAYLKFSGRLEELNISTEESAGIIWVKPENVIKFIHPVRKEQAILALEEYKKLIGKK